MSKSNAHPAQPKLNPQQNAIASWVSSHRSSIITPSYVYSPAQAASNYRDLKASLGTALVVSLKACPSIEVQARIAHVAKDGVEVSSIGELSQAVGSPGGIFVNSPACGADFIAAAIASRATLIVDNTEQFELVAPHFAKSKPNPLVLRLHSTALDRPAASREIDHFGLDLRSTVRIVERCRAECIPLSGVHYFGGSYSFGQRSLTLASAIDSVVRQLEVVYGAPLTTINLGGGFSDHWRDSQFDLHAYRQTFDKLSASRRVIHECGRAIFSSAGYFLTRIISKKTIEQTTYAICDGGLSHNFLLAQTEALYPKRRSAWVIPMTTQERQPLNQDLTLVGPSCSQSDVIGLLPRGSVAPANGDVCVFGYSGSYNFKYSMTDFLSLPIARQYVLTE